MTIAARSTLAAGMNALLARLAGVTVESVHDGGPALSEAAQQYTLPGRDTQAEIDWSVFSSEVNGIDEAAAAYDPDVPIDGDTFVPPPLPDPDPEDEDPPPAAPPLGAIIYTLRGQRRITFQVNCKSREWERDGRYYIERIQARLRLPSALDELRAMGLALQHIGPVHDVARGADEDGHAYSEHALEFVCNYAVEITDDPVTTVETINGGDGPEVTVTT